MHTIKHARGTALILFTMCIGAGPATRPAAPVYHVYAGSTHAHTAFTWSHGDQWVPAAKAAAAAGEKKEPGIYVDAEGAQYPAKTQVLKPEWQKGQGPP